jgi:hypothetical protein
MLQLPEAMEVAVSDTTGEALANILVNLDLRWHGNYYFGTHVGLTAADGIARATASAIAHSFRESQIAFPMDYKVPLAECDDTVGIGVLDSTEFISASREAASSGLVTAQAKGDWARAANADVLSRRIDVPVPVTQRVLRVALQLERSP